jgi:hypothetical protein
MIKIKMTAVLLCSCVLVIGLSGSSWAASKKAPPKKKEPVKQVAPAPALQTVVTSPSQPAKPAKAGWFVEGGLAGGAAALELGYGKSLNGTYSVSGALGYALGNKYGVVVLDLARLTYASGDLFAGAAVNYAMYSDIISNIPGISGNISNKNLVGLEVFAGKRFGRYSGRLAYGTALGLRAGLGCDL